MGRYQLSLKETGWLVAVAAAACNLYVVLKPHWGEICEIARRAIEALP